jgi:hypothetical protein
MYDNDKSGRTRLAVAQAVASAVIAGIVLTIGGSGKSVAVAAPTQWTKYTSTDKTFLCEAPNGWKKSERGVPGGMAGGVIFRQGKAVIDVSSDLMGSLMGDIAASSDAQMSNLASSLPGGDNAASVSQRRPPVEKLHLAALEDMQDKYEDYEESEMKAFPCALGEARVSEFTGKSRKMGKRRGLRATILGRERRVTVLCACRPDDFKTLSPAFSKVMRSLAAGE